MFSFKFIIGLPAAILVFHVFAHIYYWYWTIRWLDIPMHLIGGFWVAIVFLKIFQENRFSSEFFSGKFLFFASCLAFVALVGVFWELYEFLFYTFFVRDVPSEYIALNLLTDNYDDTIKDFANDLIGGILALVLYQFTQKKT